MARIQQDEGNADASRRWLQAAIAIVENDEDALLLRYKSKREIDRMRKELPAEKRKQQ